MAILDRILELEGQNHDLAAAVRQVKDEIEVSDDTRAESKPNGDKLDQKYVQRLESEVEFLRETGSAFES